ncbi:MAG: aldose 1-epimerase family protein [Anaerolineae bacterium]
MTRLYQRSWTRQELLGHIGDIGQLGGIRLFTLAEGPERGVRAAELRTAAGLRFTVYLDRGMDIGPAEYRGIPLAWISPTGPAAPAFYDPQGSGWLYSFHGGLLTTCGLTQVGPPGDDDGEHLGLHGRISNIPARQVSQGDAWEGDTYIFWIEGRMRETSVFGHNLELKRRISAQLDEPRLAIEDQVTNMGDAPSPHMILYHINLGFPLLQAESRLIAPSEEVIPRDEVAAQGIDQHTHFHAPIPRYAEQVFFHRMRAESDGYVRVVVVNQAFKLGLQLRYRQQELTEFTQWKQMGWGTYTLGIEPGNCRSEGRLAARRRGALVEIAPGQQFNYRVELSMLSDEELDELI